MSEDLIRRSDAIKVAKEFWYKPDIAGALVELPTIEPKRGEWINQHEDGHGSWVGTCNQCGKENHVDNYCPNCGAKMKGADNE